MLLTPIAIIIGLVAGFARGGSFGPWPAQPVKLVPVLVAGLVLQVSSELIDVPARAAVAFIGWLLLAVAMGANLHLGGAGVMGLGMLANAVPILFNGAVPVSPGALVESGRVASEADLANTTVNAPWELETSETTLGILGDTIPLRINDDIVSFGDLLVAAGLVFFVMNVLMQWASGRRSLARRRRADAGGLDVIDLVDEPVPAGVGAAHALDLTDGTATSVVEAGAPATSESIWAEQFEQPTDGWFTDTSGPVSVADTGMTDTWSLEPGPSAEPDLWADGGAAGDSTAATDDAPTEAASGEGSISLADWLGDPTDAVLDIRDDEAPVIRSTESRHGVSNVRRLRTDD